MCFDVCILFIVVCLPVNLFADGKNENKSFFVPTREWQVVNKGTPIPKGLHVRHNFQTGKTEAKLLNTDDGSEKSIENSNAKRARSLIIYSDQPLKDVGGKFLKKSIKASPEIPFQEMKLQLKRIKSDEPEKLLDRVKEVRENFKSYEELKKEFESLNMNISTEMELLKDFFERFVMNKDALVLETSNKSRVKNILDILNDLEYLVHQIDNAQVFTDMGGITKIISPCLNSTSNEIKSEALRLLGAMAQSNPSVQAKALESDLIQKILHILITNSNVEIKSRCLFALSSLLRQFPAAQKVFVYHGGIEIFVNILQGNQVKSQTRVLNLVNDLIIERRNIGELPNKKQRHQKTKAYAVTNFEQKLLMHGFCRCFSNFMKKLFQNVIMRDLIEEADEIFQLVVESMFTLNPVCRKVFIHYRTSLLLLIENILTDYKLNLEAHNDQEKESDSYLMLTLEKLKVLLDFSHDEL